MSREASMPGVMSPPSNMDSGRGNGDRRRGNDRGGQKQKGDRFERPKRGKKIDVDSRRKARQNRKAERKQEALAAAPQREDIFEVGPEGMSVPDLAEMLAVPAVDIVKKLFMKGLAVQVNSTLDPETVKLVGEEYGVDVLDVDEESVEDSAKKSRDFLAEDDVEDLQSRPPVVTVMGHVDHGKTSLLDFVRKSKVAAGEAGGITQSIGAYTCSVDGGEGEKAVTFLDTPGHEAFSAMRARGARVTDIAIIIVAADDGVRPQTLEAISHAKAAGVPIVVAINKVDKEGANPERVKQELTEVELVPEEWGGKTPMVSISAKKGTGVDELLETVLLVAELEELVANPDRAATGTVLEAQLDRKSGPVTTLIVQNGELKVGDSIAAGSAYGKVRSMRTSAGDVNRIGPSMAAQVLGLNAVPQAGDEFEVFESETRARQAAEAVEDARRLERLSEMAGGGNMVTLSSLASMDDDSEEQTLQRMNIILKADASGSCEAVKAALSALPQDTVMLRYLLAAPGDITASDIDLALASGGMVLGFNVQPSEAVAAEAKKNGITLRTYSVIYDLVDDVRAAMEGRLRTVEEKVKVGEAEVKAVFGSGNRKAAGCLVTDGTLTKEAVIYVKRGKKTVFEGKLTSLRRVKDDVKEVPSGVECGIAAEGFRDWAEGDVVEAYDLVEKKLKLEEAHAATISI
jgi:translation initiation factor IF-2